MIIILYVERAEWSLLVTVNRKLAGLDVGDCGRSNMISLGSALFVAFAVLLSVFNLGCDWQLCCGLAKLPEQSPHENNFASADCSGYVAACVVWNLLRCKSKAISAT